MEAAVGAHLSQRRHMSGRRPDVGIAYHASHPLTIRHPSERIISIYEDATLRKGDAVMTRNGIRVFAGSMTWPYLEADFQTISEAQFLRPKTREVLGELDHQRHG